MKNLKRALVLLMALVVVFSLTSCDKSGSIKKAFEKEGWTVKTVNAEDSGVKTVLKILLSDKQIEDLANYEIMWCTSGILNTAVVIKFPSSGAVKDFLTVEDKDGNKDTSAYETAKENGTINGNCLLITLSSEAKEIFK